MASKLIEKANVGHIIAILYMASVCIPLSLSRPIPDGAFEAAIVILGVYLGVGAKGKAQS